MGVCIGVWPASSWVFHSEGFPQSFRNMSDATIPLLGSFQGLGIEVFQPALCRCAETEYFSYSSPSCFSCFSNKRGKENKPI